MNRRKFLAVAGSALARPFPQPDGGGFDRNSPNYRLVRQVSRVDQIFAERNPSPDGRWTLSFSNFQTTPEGDQDIVIPCTHGEPGFHVQGVQHETTLWVPSKHAAVLMITFESTANVTVFRHVNRSQEIVVDSSPCE
jgi:hypothetical protein